VIHTFYKLDNPVWFSLQETHRDYCQDFGETKFYKPDYCPFGGFIGLKGLSKGIDTYSQNTQRFFIVGSKPTFSKKITLQHELICNQMLLEKPIALDFTEEITVLNPAQFQELYDLVNAVQPGYFRQKTPELGAYCGIYKEGKLVAAAGERMKMNEFTEVSAIVTLPEYRGRGLAKQLTAFISNGIFRENKIPYLHVARSNDLAVSLYQKLGFSIRAEISFWTLSGR
jgi:ribosomal protein S18 acetylase RimI-like enzyme